MYMFPYMYSKDKLQSRDKEMDKLFLWPKLVGFDLFIIKKKKKKWKHSERKGF